MNWQPWIEFGVYALVGIGSFLLWWFIYERVLTREHSTRDAVFGFQPNPAVAFDVFGGFLAIGILNHSIIGGPALESFWLDLEATVLTLVGTIALLALLRWIVGEFLRLWFGKKRDTHGDIITINNELFKQRNIATGIFSTTLYLILVAGLLQEDFLNITGNRLAATFNMLGVWLLGIVAILLHSWLFLGLGGKHNILHESFHENNPAAPTSLLGLMAGVLILNHQLLESLELGEHMFNQWELWARLLLGMVSVFVLKGILHIFLRGLLGVNVRQEMLERHNPAWGILDGGLIFGLMLILIALIS